ncbi:SHOCT domain-containing protein [Arthrobacter oryzae]|uniref:Putative membrane protein n=1 Tax=Arthrobacter oryzae TaxID=409290 RepID=A0A495ETM2_9MICC|nr:SHOCT domain-containing protein [Arthrobacter oryzae]RKR19919.1 putative membrane protein [Arthrobacter oryzae]
MMWDYGYQVGWMWLWGVFMLAGIVVLVILAVRLLTGGLRHDRPGAPPGTGPHAPGQYPPPGQGGVPGSYPPPNAAPDSPPGRSPARLILDERFARGELTVEQYRENLKVLDEES